MTFANYKPRQPVGPGRGGTLDNGEHLWAVVHTSEGSEGLNSAEGLVKFIGTPATPAPNLNLASYHEVFDTDGIFPVVPHDKRANHAGGGNVNGLGGCIPGTARQTRAQWFDDITAQYLERCAEWLADLHIAYGIPLVKLLPDDLVAGRRGVCGHVDVSNAFHKSDHTDPGTSFPWDWLITRANHIVAPPPEEDEVTAEEVQAMLDHLEERIINRINRSIEVTREGRQEQRRQFQALGVELTDDDNAE
jgi:hypothetical protein